MIQDNIIFIRRCAQLRQKDVAGAAKIPLKRYKQMELGDVIPKSEELDALAAVFNIRTEALVYGLFADAKFGMQPLFFSPYRTPKEYQFAVDKITALTQEETEIIMLCRSSGKTNEILQLLYETYHTE